jgi:hypothetical protein
MSPRPDDLDPTIEAELVHLIDDGEPFGQAFDDKPPTVPADIDEDAELWDGYRRWLCENAARDLARGDNPPALALLLQWARETLPGPTLPCRCAAGLVCLRCKVVVVVEGGTGR